MPGRRPEMADLQRPLCNPVQRTGLACEPPEHTGTSFGRLVEENLLANLVLGQRLRREFRLLEFELLLDCALEGVLQGGNRLKRNVPDRIDDQRVTSVVDIRRDSLDSLAFAEVVVLVVVRRLRVLGPLARVYVDVESEDRLLFAASPAQVDTPQRRRRTVLEFQKGDAVLLETGSLDALLAPFRCEAMRRDHLVPLPLALLFVRGNPLGSAGGDLVNLE